MRKPMLIVVNGLPGSGKTSLAARLAADLRLPVFSRDGIYETLYDALGCGSGGVPPLLGSTAFALLYYSVGLVLAAGQSVIVEGFFGRPELRTAEFRRLQHAHDFEPFQILCRADGNVLLQRFLERAGSAGRHSGHHDLSWLEQNRELLLQGQIPPLAFGGQIVEVDTTTLETFDYTHLIQPIRSSL